MMSKMGFANEINGTRLGDECHRFGITWGCQPDCPVFERGECEIQEENKKKFEQLNKK